MSPRPRHPDYERTKARARLRSAVESRLGRDIGDIPPVGDPERRMAATASFQRACELYFPHRFTLAWSQDHLKVISKVERAMLLGETLAVAMPRGSGKTTICEAAVICAVVIHGHPFAFLIGNAEDHALGLLEDVKAELAGNDRLLEDFPEVIYPIRCLENQPRRCQGQIHHGQPTYIAWGTDEIVLPTIPGSRASNAVIRVAGITGNIRGAVHTRPDGSSVRPTFVLIDDPQTDQSARSPAQCAQRERIVSGTVLGLAGPGKKISALMPCTVIARGDLADNMLDRDKHPEWQGERTSLCYAFPTNEKLWEEYARIRKESLIADGDGREATEFYHQHQAEMDAGAVVAWPQRHNPDELSAIQHIMNLRLRDEHAFFAEYQNAPIQTDAADVDFRLAAAGDIASRINGLHRGVVPGGARWLTAFVDVQANVLYWLVAAWRDAFGGAVVDYGTWPDQGRPYFTARDLRKTLGDATGASTVQGAVLTGLSQLVANLAGREFRREDGAAMRINLCMVDSGYESTLVYEFCRRSTHSNLLLPSKGVGLTASKKPIEEYTRKRGERQGHHWFITVAGNRINRYVLIDTNWWKTWVHQALQIVPGDPGALTLFGRGNDSHRLLADHLTSETCVRTEGRGRVVYEWAQKPAKPDNHWFDCLVGAAVAASTLGCTTAGQPTLASRPKTKLKLSEVQAQRRSV